MMDGFTLLRPELGWAAIPLLVIAIVLIRAQGQRGQWHSQIDPLLLPHLLEGAAPRGRRYRIAIVSAVCLLGLIALLGPSWQRQATPLVKNQDALVVVLDLSTSMYAQDIQPSRLQQAKYKIRDLLTLRQDGQTGLVASAGDAFVVAPLTDDGNTLLTLLPSLSPAMMPLQGSNPLAGLRQAQQLLEQGSAGRGRILFVGDGIDEKQWSAVSAFAKDSPHNISVLAVGTAEGAPIPNREGGFIKDADGNIAVAKLTRERLRDLAGNSGGQYRELTLDNSDIAPFSDAAATLAGATGTADGDQWRADQWQDGGIWFVLLMLPLAVLGFHRSALSVVLAALPAALLASGLALVSPPGHAQPPPRNEAQQAGGSVWDNLWRTPDQQGAALMDRDPAAAATRFADPMWRGSALYRAGDFSAAAEAFAQHDSATAHYNRGNALAQAGQLEEAIAAYEKALEKDPDLEDAARNRDILQQQQEQQKQQQQDGQQGNPDDQSGSESKDNAQSNGDQGDAGKNNQKSSGGNPSQDSQNSDSPDQQSAKQESTNSDSPSDGGNPSDAQDSAQQQAQQQSADDYVKQSAQADKGEADTQAQAAQAGEPDDSANQPAQGAVSGRMSEEDQAGEQWLRQIPDSSDQLLRNKFRYQYLQRRNDGDVPDDDDYAPY